ncbi:MAG: D-glucuronyl C5-epimerase family protein [Saprospiraceae bacterium]|nr:D-glucuronyl C5-epimerase family protein [Saprospiraceae bacterium]
MNLKSRFFDFPYVLNTLSIKAKALKLSLMRGSYPYDYFKKSIHPVNIPPFTLSFKNTYTSLLYLDSDKAERLHTGNKSVTQEIIIGLVKYNDLISDHTNTDDQLLNYVDNIQEKALETDDSLLFYFNLPYDRFDLVNSYSSGIVQGKMASLCIRCYNRRNNKKYLNWAKKSLISAWSPISEGGLNRTIENQMNWVEEYPSPKPSMVLNGFLFYIIGLAEYLCFDSDKEIVHIFESCLVTVLAWMPKYKLDNGLLYSMYRWNLCNVHYTGIMKYQFDHLFELTNIPLFKEYAEYTNQLTNWNTFNRIIKKDRNTQKIIQRTDHLK